MTGLHTRDAAGSVVPARCPGKRHRDPSPHVCGGDPHSSAVNGADVSRTVLGARQCFMTVLSRPEGLIRPIVCPLRASSKTPESDTRGECAPCSPGISVAWPSRVGSSGARPLGENADRCSMNWVREGPRVKCTGGLRHFRPRTPDTGLGLGQASHIRTWGASMGTWSGKFRIEQVETSGQHPYIRAVASQGNLSGGTGFQSMELRISLDPNAQTENVPAIGSYLNASGTLQEQPAQ